MFAQFRMGCKKSGGTVKMDYFELISTQFVLSSRFEKQYRVARSHAYRLENEAKTEAF